MEYQEIIELRTRVFDKLDKLKELVDLDKHFEIDKLDKLVEFDKLVEHDKQGQGNLLNPPLLRIRGEEEGCMLLVSW